MTTPNVPFDLLNAQNRTLDALTSSAVTRVTNIIKESDNLDSDLHDAFDRFSRLAATLGTAAADRHLGSIGLTSTTTYAVEISSVKDKLDEALAEYRTALSAGNDSQEARSAAIRRLSFRVRLGVGYAIQEAYNSANVERFRGAQSGSVRLGKMWVASYENGNIPCPACAALSGRTIPVEQEFTSHHFPRVWGPLYGPPRHPNCRCRLVPVVLQGTDIEIPVPDQPDLPKRMTSAKVRAMSSKKFNGIRKVLMAIVSSVRKLRK